MEIRNRKASRKIIGLQYLLKFHLSHSLFFLKVLTSSLSPVFIVSVSGAVHLAAAAAGNVITKVVGLWARKWKYAEGDLWRHYTPD